MELMKSMKISASGLSAQRTKMNVIAENLANSETTRTKEGGPYRRKMVVFQATPVENFERILEDQERKMCGPEQMCPDKEKQCKTPCDPENREEEHLGVEVTEIVESQEDFRLVYNPNHPDADPVTGYVAMPNVDHLTEMADMMVARRAYDANVTALSNTKSMILKALEIGK
ncbi:MAG: flagellar basal body rod protein FlgC [Proteobacteria bacterium]|nr:flagellar basal body rod protein FlgC [Pseudomonadota bacterium]